VWERRIDEPDLAAIPSAIDALLADQALRRIAFGERSVSLAIFGLRGRRLLDLFPHSFSSRLIGFFDASQVSINESSFEEILPQDFPGLPFADCPVDDRL
jgi:hypothetical protein